MARINYQVHYKLFNKNISNKILVGALFFTLCFIFRKTSAQEKCSGETEFRCRSQECIKKEFLCDGSKECIDGSDETQDLCKFRSCNKLIDYVDRDEDDLFAIPTLGTGKSFRCNYGACISNQFVCDGIRHCVADGSDETADVCSSRRCLSGEFKCDYGGCIPRRNVCDNRHHCHDRSDETSEACRKRVRRCTRRRRRFQCDFGACIHERKKCDGKYDCLDCSDESEKNCGSKAKEGQCPNSKYPFKDPVGITTPRPATIKPSSPSSTNRVGPGGGCQQTTDDNIHLEIIACGDDSDCNDLVLPSGTVMLIFCEGEPVPLSCQDDGLWHFPRDPSKAPRVKPCEDTGTGVDGNIEKRTPSPRPKNCGSLPPFSPLPWLVGLFKGGVFSCTGTLIGPTVVLTAGHCIVSNQATSSRTIQPSDLKIQYYSQQPNDPTKYIPVSSIEIHPKYIGGDSPRFDVALLFLEQNLASSFGLSSACVDDAGKLLGISAWTFNRTVGQQQYKWKNFQQVIDLTCFNKATECTRHLIIGDNQFCSINEQEPLYLHPGASGGPYLISKNVSGQDRWAVAGVVSSSIQTTDCGTRTVFTSVSKLYQWIINCSFHGNCQA